MVCNSHGSLQSDTNSDRCILSESYSTHLSVVYFTPFYCFSFTEKDGVTTSKNKKITAEKDGKATKANNLPLTGAEVVQLFVKKRDLGELELYYLKEVESDSYRYT